MKTLESRLSNEYYTLYAGCSRWTNAMRGHALHISTRTGNPLCGMKYQNGASDRPMFNLDAVTCKKCKRIYENLLTQKQNGSTENT